jgi:hypothetical protein
MLTMPRPASSRVRKSERSSAGSPQPLLVGDVEGDIENAFLHFAEVQQPGEEHGTHLAHGGTDWVTLAAEQVPELDRNGLVAPVLKAKFGSTGREDVVGSSGGRTGHGEAGKVALHIGDEAGNARGGEALDQALQRDRLARAGCARDQAVAVGEPELQRLRPRAAALRANEDTGHQGTHPSWPRPSEGRARRRECQRAMSTPTNLSGA